MSFDLVYYNDNSYFFDEDINHFDVSNSCMSEENNLLNYYDKNIIKTIADNIIQLKKNNMKNEDISKIIVIATVILQMYFLSKNIKTKT